MFITTESPSDTNIIEIAPAAPLKEPAKEFVSELIGYADSHLIAWKNYKSKSDIELPEAGIKGIGITTLLNDVPQINQYLETLNHILKKGDYLVLFIETKHIRAEKLYKRHPKPFGYAVYALDFIVHRIFPKISPTKKIYLKLTNGKNRTLSLSESLARVICYGFELQGYKRFGDSVMVVGQKVSEPIIHDKISRGLLIKLPRIGKNGDIIHVYKLRTMHPYSEFLQEYLYEKHGTKDGDKIENDFRVARWGKLFRKFWLDEIPMLWNWIKRDLKLIGVRPLSEHKFNTYPEYLQAERTKHKPGMIPPYYVKLPETPEDFFDTEREYLEEYSKNPLKTDLTYLRKSLYNIIFRGVRSR